MDDWSGGWGTGLAPRSLGSGHPDRQGAPTATSAGLALRSWPSLPRSARHRETRPIQPWKRPGHGVFFPTVADRGSKFEALLRGLSGRDRVPALVEALGLKALVGDGAAEGDVAARAFAGGAALRGTGGSAGEGEGGGMGGVPREPGPSDGRLGTPDRFGLGGEPEVLGVAVVGERSGLLALLIELEGRPDAGTLDRLARRVRSRNPVRPYLFLFADRRYAWLALASHGLDGELRHLVVDRARPRRTDVEALEEMAAEPGEGGVALALRHARALDRSRVTRQFFGDFKAWRAQVAAAWSGIPETLVSEREQLALLLLCRLMFLYFLQRGGHLCGDERYLPRLHDRWRREPHPGSTFFRRVLQPLFFGALNTRPEARGPDAQALGGLPYLNGGLFERHAFERRFSELDLPDAVLAGVFDGLLERYRFTTLDRADAVAGTAPRRDARSEDAGGVDPEMLGRVFEGLMAPDRRGLTGTYYTPAPMVDRVVREALATYLTDRAGLAESDAYHLVHHGDARFVEPRVRKVLADELARVRVLDPACGSGAFLLGALSRLTRVRRALEGPQADLAEIRRQIVGRALHGVDVQEDAALLCALRLWLALAVESGGSSGVRPLPNLDRRIRQGDALLDPLDLGANPAPSFDTGWATARVSGVDRAVRQALRRIGPLSEQYVGAGPEERPALMRELTKAEAELARGWIAALERRIIAHAGELRSWAESRDLFGEPPAGAAQAERAWREAERRLAELRRVGNALEDSGALPFFSFGVHFADAVGQGFDLIVANPPWVRAHHWPAPSRALLRARFEVCRSPGWRRGAVLVGAPGAVGAQVDLSLLFVERAIRLLAPGGVLALVLPAKALRSLYGAGARRMLLRELDIAVLEDHSLDQRSIFRADAFASVLVARRRGDDTQRTVRQGDTSDTDTRSSPAPVRITLVRRGVDPLRFTLDADALPVLPGDSEAPWLLAPPAVQAVLRRMQAAGPPLGLLPGLRVHRGVVTGANDVLVVPEASAKLGGLAAIRAEGHDRARRTARSRGDVARYRALVESAALAPLVRGGGIRAWSYRTAGYVIWCHDSSSAAPVHPPPRMERYLARHATILRARTGWRPGLPDGALFRLSTATLQPKVAWHDLSDTLKAVALPGTARGVDGVERPLIPLNTVYFVPVAEPGQALRLAALFNALPVRTFARAVAERAKNARFRFLAWTIAVLPIPDGWDRGDAGHRLLTLSRAAHRQGAIPPETERELDRIVAGLYGLGPGDLDTLRGFDQWLRGVPST